LLLELFEDLKKIKKCLVLGPLFYVESQRQDVPWILADAAIVFGHVIKQGILVTEMVICLHLCVNAPLVGNVCPLGFLTKNGRLRFFSLFYSPTWWLLISLLFRVGSGYLKLFEYLEMILAFPLCEDKVMLLEVFSKQL
jgi:hypothetical protein